MRTVDIYELVFTTLKPNVQIRHRPNMQMQAAEFELMKLSNKVRFILAVIAGELKINNRKKADIVEDLDAMGYDRIAPLKKAKHLSAADAFRLT